jgi:hypothetical protein
VGLLISLGVYNIKLSILMREREVENETERENEMEMYDERWRE